jgi:uncharacterized protein YbjT (DUF2867 family)
MVVLLAGATGLVGRECLRLLAADPAVSRVVVLARRALQLPAPPDKLAVHLVDFERLGTVAPLLVADAVVCALGTTMRVARSRERFRQVDCGYAVAFARLALAGGARHFLLVSALGVDARSRVFYNRVKGETEDAIRALGYRSLTIVRPSVLLGDRGEFRLGEAMAKRIASLVPGRLRAVSAAAVAAVLVRAAIEDAPGTRVIESEAIRRPARLP